mgnify:CR=1 FL=1
MKVKVYSIKGTKLADFALPKEYVVDVNLNLLAQAKRVYEMGSHVGLRKTKTRSEVNKTKKKLYKQKGTGGARHGSKNAPIFVGGGVAHGPRPLKRVLELPKKMKKLALNMALSLRAKNGDLILVDGVNKIKKTKESASFLEKIKKDLKTKRFVVATREMETLKFFRNIENVLAVNFVNLNTFHILTGGTLILDKDIFEKAKKTK